ncbi:MAG: hypothetical protein SPH82_12785 [Eubacteriales bacterium]|nr:hypothetical protein [Eubacteriales bacterium]
MNDVQAILSALSALRIGPQPEEYEIHDAVARALDAAGIPYVHECRLLPGRRIDFACGSVGIEVKKGRPDGRRLRAQLARYLEQTQLTAAIVVLQRPCRLPDRICDKPVYTVALNRLWGVALY